MGSYTVFVSQPDGSGRVTLTTTSDGEKASELASVLVSAASGNALEIGIMYTPGDAGSGGAGGGGAAAQSKPAATAQNRNAPRGQ